MTTLIISIAIIVIINILWLLYIIEKLVKYNLEMWKLIKSSTITEYVEAMKEEEEKQTEDNEERYQDVYSLNYDDVKNITLDINK